MLRSGNDLVGYELEATDGDVGKVETSILTNPSGPSGIWSSTPAVGWRAGGC